MNWIKIFLLPAILGSCLAKPEETNDVSLPPPPINLDANLRRALLKALTELENEDNEKHGIKSHKNYESGNKIVEKASASAVSIYTNSESTVFTTEKLPQTTAAETEKPFVLVQKSNGVQQRTITTIENDPKDLDGFGNAEHFLTSASNSFTPNKFPKSSTLNLVTTEDKSTRRNKVETPRSTEPTPTSTTPENEAKVEDVQFFSAPLVAAFTVHQDERGLPKKVEPIYRTASVVKKDNEIRTKSRLEQEKQAIPQENLLVQASFNKQHLEFEQKQLNNRLALQQKALEEEILRLRHQQQQQELVLRQQLEQEKRLRDQIRIRHNNNDESFHPVVNPSFTLPQTKPKQVVSLQPSITFDPLVEAGKLPLNAQILPVKNPTDFRSPIVQTPHFQQYHSISQQSLPQVNNFNNFNSFGNTGRQSNRIFRQESGTGNFLNSDFNRNTNTHSFSIQKSVPFANPGFRLTNLNTPQLTDNRFVSSGFNSQEPLPSTFNFPNFGQNRFFRSNIEEFSHFQPPPPPPQNNYYLNNLLYNSGALRGKQGEDLSIITKVLSLNHLGSDSRYAASARNELRVPPPKRV